MPVQYSSITDEHLCVRKSAGIFDICHMGEFDLRGPTAQADLERWQSQRDQAQATLAQSDRKVSLSKTLASAALTSAPSVTSAWPMRPEMGALTAA